MAEIRVSLSDLVSIATLWLLLWEKGWEQMAERNKGESRNGVGSDQSWIRILYTFVS